MIEMKKQKVIFIREYEGFESISDIQRDVIECFDESFNKLAEGLPSEFRSKITLKITYEENVLTEKLNNEGREYYEQFN